MDSTPTELRGEVHDRGVLGDPLPGAHRAAPGRAARARVVDRAAALRLAARVGRRRRHARPAARGALTDGTIADRVEGLRSVTG